MQPKELQRNKSNYFEHLFTCSKTLSPLPAVSLPEINKHYYDYYISPPLHLLTTISLDITLTHISYITLHKCVTQDKISHRIAFVIGWSKWHSLLVASCKSDLLQSSSSSTHDDRARQLFISRSDQKSAQSNVIDIDKVSSGAKDGLIIELDDIQQTEESQEKEEKEEENGSTSSVASTATSTSATTKSVDSKLKEVTVPWIQIMRVETLWDRSTCEQSFRLLLKNLQLPTRTEKQVCTYILACHCCYEHIYIHAYKNTKYNTLMHRTQYTQPNTYLYHQVHTPSSTSIKKAIQYNIYQILSIMLDCKLA